MKPFKWKAQRGIPKPTTLDRLAPEPVSEPLSGEIGGEAASDLEERLFYALVKKFGFANVEFQPSFISSKGLPDEIRPDFVIWGQPQMIVVFADGEFTHHTAQQQAEDRVKDARLMERLTGLIEPPVHIPERELGSMQEAWEAVDRRF